MSDTNNFVPTWLQLALTAAIALISAVTGIVVTAWRVSERLKAIENKFSEGLMSLRLHVDASDSRRFHDLVGVIQQEIGKSDLANQRLEDRVGALEQDQAVMRDFKRRIEPKNS